MSQAPDWHDAPTCAGKWLCDEGSYNVDNWLVFRVGLELLTDDTRSMWNDGSRYYGPLPNDTKEPGK